MEEVLGKCLEETRSETSNGILECSFSHSFIHFLLTGAAGHQGYPRQEGCLWPQGSCQLHGRPRKTHHSRGALTNCQQRVGKHPRRSASRAVLITSSDEQSEDGGDSPARGDRVHQSLEPRSGPCKCQPQIGTCHGHLLSTCTRIKSWATAAVDLHHPLKELRVESRNEALYVPRKLAGQAFR